MTLNPMIAAAAMAASSLSVVTNANRLRGFGAPAVAGEAIAVSGAVRVEVGERVATKKEETMATVKDPVCRMEIDPATAAGSEEYRGRRTTSARRAATTASWPNPRSTRLDPV